MWHNHITTLLPHFTSSRRRPPTVDCSHRHVGTQFFAAIMLHRPEPTNERGEPTILSKLPIVVTHLAIFTLLLVLQIQRYMWHNHVATWA